MPLIPKGFDYLCFCKNCDTMKKAFHAIAVLILMCFLLPSCKMRPKDAVRLKAEAEAGNMKSMEMLAVYGDTLVSATERNHYLDILVKNGNYRALAAKYSEEYYKNGKLSEKQWQSMYMRWMEKGARMGTPECMYRLGVMYLEEKQLDSTKALYWLRQAADSLQASARVEIRKAEGKQTVLDAPCFAFRQMWDYNARGQSFLNRFSNATFHFMAECLRSSWKNLFGPRWWQSLLLMVFMFGVLIASIVYSLSRRGREAISAAASGIYGWINGMTLFFFAKGKSAVTGILVSSDAIGQFSRQPATYGQISDICIWCSWGCLIIIVLVYLMGLVERIKLGKLSVRSFLTYTFGTVFSCVFFYCLAGAISVLSKVLGFILAGGLFGLIAGGEGSEEDQAKWEKKLAKMAEEAKKRQEEEQRKRHEKEQETWYRQLAEWRKIREKNG